jgi:hypothetical protein
MSCFQRLILLLVVNGTSLLQSAPLYKSVVPVSHFAVGVAIRTHKECAGGLSTITPKRPSRIKSSNRCYMPTQ